MMLLSLWILALTAVSRVSSAPYHHHHQQQQHQQNDQRRRLEHPKLLRRRAQETVIPDEFIVVLHSDVQEDPDEVGRHAVFDHGSIQYAYRYAFKGFSATLSVFELVNLLEDDRVAYIEENSMHHITNFQYNAPWNLDRMDQQDLPLNGIYSYDATGSSVSLYVIDSGLLQSHSEFGNRASCALDLLNPLRRTCIDTNGHGTHVAGIAAGSTYGMAKRVSIKSIRICGSTGSCPTNLMVDALDYVVSRPGKKVTNLSILGSYSQAFEDASQGALARGVVVVMAAGNDNESACGTTADSEASISVGSVDRNDTRSWFSNYGPCVDIWAPGSDIVSTSSSGETETEIRDGTSMATPHVAGAAAMLLQQGVAPENVLSTLLAQATPDVLSDIQPGSPNLLLHMPNDLTFPPTTAPSETPSVAPSVSMVPTMSLQPSIAPSLSPSQHPSELPSDIPSQHPSLMPSETPSVRPSEIPSQQPTISLVPSLPPSDQPSGEPTAIPTYVPSSLPSEAPSSIPSHVPSPQPSVPPTWIPSPSPSAPPSHQPSVEPSLAPSLEPSIEPTHAPSTIPSILPPSPAPSSHQSRTPKEMYCPANTACWTSMRCCSGYNCTDRKWFWFLMGRCRRRNEEEN